MQLFYSKDISRKINQFTFDKTESRHIIKVLRKKEGDTIFITDGIGILYKSKITMASDKKCVVMIESANQKPKPWKYYLHVAIAPTKNIDRFEWFLEKATEIGIDEITPILCEHSERKTIKKERLDKIVESAMKQSLKYQLPKLNQLISFQEFINEERTGNLLIAHCALLDKTSIKSTLQTNEPITVLIGPEGDFSNTEIENAKLQHFRPVDLGESRLRTETAGVVVTSMVSFFHQ